MGTPFLHSPKKYLENRINKKWVQCNKNRNRHTVKIRIGCVQSVAWNERLQ